MLHRQCRWWSWGLGIVEKKDEGEDDKNWGRYSKGGGRLDALSVSVGGSWNVSSQIFSVIWTNHRRPPRTLSSRSMQPYSTLGISTFPSPPLGSVCSGRGHVNNKVLATRPLKCPSQIHPLHIPNNLWLCYRLLLEQRFSVQRRRRQKKKLKIDTPYLRSLFLFSKEYRFGLNLSAASVKT